MTIKDILLITLFLTPSIVLAEQDSYNSVLEYGIIDFDRLYDWDDFPEVNQNLTTQSSLLNFTYYFNSVYVSNEPYNLAPVLGRSSWIKTKVINNLVGNINVNGQYYLDNGYDIEYQFSNSEQFDTKNNGIDIGVTVNSQISDEWKLGLGLQKNSNNRVHYVYRGNDFDSFFYKFQNETAWLLQAQYLNAQNNVGWHIRTQFNYDPSNDSGRADMTAEYYSSIKLSTTLYLGLMKNNRIENYEEESYLVGISQKYWTSKYKSIDYGLSWNLTKENSMWGSVKQKETNDIIVFDLNWTWRF